MKQLIHDIIKFDQKAQREINDLKAEKETLSIEVEKMKKILSKKDEKILALEVGKLQDLYEKQEQSAMLELEKKYQAKLQALENEYQNKESLWLDDLFNFCIKKA